MTEGVFAAIAAYTQTLDDGRTVEVVITFYPDGVRDIPALATTNRPPARSPRELGRQVTHQPLDPRLAGVRSPTHQVAAPRRCL